MSVSGREVGKYGEIIFDSETPRGIERISAIKKENPDAVIVFGTGCFDVAQPGHPIFTEQMRTVGEDVVSNTGRTLSETKVIVVVGVGRDSTLRALKREPVSLEMNRAYMVASYKNVDFVVLNGKEIGDGKVDFGGVLKTLRPDVFVLNSDDSALFTKKQLCESLGILFTTVERVVPSYLMPTSSTEIIAKIQGMKS
jgi:bifunctional ADP-heptose synthase (sugar kinase/adenylyltransferase)